MPKVLTQHEVDRRANWTALCGVCAKPFGWSKNGDKAKFCSRVCAGRSNGKISISRGKLNSYICQECGKAFHTYHKNRLFCERACSHKNWIKNMPRNLRGKLDNNHKEVVDALEKAGALVLDMAHVGKGFPDLIVGIRGQFILMEIKNPKTAYGRRGLNPNQVTWHAKWIGYPLSMVDGPEAALRAIGCLK